MNDENNGFTNDVGTKKKNILLPIAIVVIIAIIVGAYFLITKLGNKEEDNNKGNENVPVETEKVTPLMYEITKEGSDNKIYLFGSIHFANISKIEFPEYLLNAYTDSDYVACEFDVIEFMKNVDQQKLAEEYIYNDGTTLEDHLSKETYDKVIKYLKDNFNYEEEMAKVFKASYIESLITQLILKDTGISTISGIDTHFLNKAKADKKTILEVESYELQTEAQNKISDKYYDLALAQVIDKYDEAVNDMKELYAAWSSGDVNKLIEITEDNGDTEEEKALVDEYNKLLLFDRNIGMANKLKEYFNDNKKVFYMVGAAHLVGDKGIAKLIENEGYIVKKVN